MFLSTGKEYASRFNGYVMARRWVLYPLLYAIVWLIVAAMRLTGFWPMSFPYTFLVTMYPIAGTFVLRELAVIWQSPYKRAGLPSFAIGGLVGLIVYFLAERSPYPFFYAGSAGWGTVIGSIVTLWLFRCVYSRGIPQDH